MALHLFIVETGTVSNGRWCSGGLSTSTLAEDSEVSILFLRNVLRTSGYRLHHGDHLRLFREDVEVLTLHIDTPFWRTSVPKQVIAQGA